VVRVITWVQVAFGPELNSELWPTVVDAEAAVANNARKTAAKNILHVTLIG